MEPSTMPEPQIDPLRAAAATLLAGAPAGAVLLAMRALLDGWDASESAPPAAAVRPPQVARQTDGNGAAPKPLPPPRASPAPAKAVAAAENAEWERLRLAIRAARTARSLTVHALADELGMAHATIRTALQTHRLPTRRLRQKLTDWLASAQEVSAGVPVLPFRSGRTGNGTGNGSTNGAGNGTGNGTGNGADYAAD
jgi:hypothetical protein